jgi:hypothetical protein
MWLWLPVPALILCLLRYHLRETHGMVKELQHTQHVHCGYLLKTCIGRWRKLEQASGVQVIVEEYGRYTLLPNHGLLTISCSASLNNLLLYPSLYFSSGGSCQFRERYHDCDHLPAVALHCELPSEVAHISLAPDA